MEGGGTFPLINRGGGYPPFTLSHSRIPPKPLHSIVLKKYIYINKIIVMIFNKKMSVTK